MEVAWGGERQKGSKYNLVAQKSERTKNSSTASRAKGKKEERGGVLTQII